MIHFFHFSIPHDMARKLAVASDPRTAGDQAYAVKAVLQECFGEGTVRPWRLVPDFEMFRVVGVVADPKAVKANTMSRRYGVVAEPIDYELPEDETFTLDVTTTPVKRFYTTDNRRRQVSAAAELVEHEGVGRMVEPRDPEAVRMAYGRWLCERLQADGTGLELVDYPEILNTRPVRHNRRRHHDDSIMVVSLPFLHARVPVRVADRDKAEAFLRKGLMKGKDIGLGAMLPLPVLDEVA